jgi:hypothetical protein
MEYKVTFKKDGKVVHEVLNRQEHDCNEISKVTQQMGTLISDEHLPDRDCPTVHEVNSGG